MTVPAPLRTTLFEERMPARPPSFVLIALPTAAPEPILKRRQVPA